LPDEFRMAPQASSLDWLGTTIIVIFSVAMIGAFSWGAVLEIRFIGPYTLKAASRQQKWQRAAVIVFLQTIPFALIGLVGPVINPDSSDPWFAMPLCCGTAWFIAYPLSVLLKLWEFERHLKRYHKINEGIRKGALSRVSSSPVFKPITWLMTTELKRFFTEGYPEDSMTELNGTSHDHE